MRGLFIVLAAGLFVFPVYAQQIPAVTSTAERAAVTFMSSGLAEEEPATQNTSSLHLAAGTGSVTKVQSTNTNGLPVGEHGMMTLAKGLNQLLPEESRSDQAALQGEPGLVPLSTEQVRALIPATNHGKAPVNVDVLIRHNPESGTETVEAAEIGIRRGGLSVIQSKEEDQTRIQWNQDW